MPDKVRAAILEKFEPPFAEAERDGKWFFCSYQRLWFSPQQLEAAHKDGRFIWSVSNFRLRNPSEMLDESARDVKEATDEHERRTRLVDAWKLSAPRKQKGTDTNA